jgi:hypothetical protein
MPGAPEGPVRIEATRLHRRLATAGQWLVLLLIAGLVAAGMRIVAHFWPSREEPQIGRVLWLFMSALTMAALSLGWLILVLQDLVKLSIEVTREGIRVDRLLAPFRAAWNDVREIGIVRSRGHVTVRSTRGSVTATARLLGAAPFAALVAALEAHAAPVVHEWSVWAATRRQLMLLSVPVLGFAFLLLAAQGFLGGRRGRGGPPR